MGKGTIEEILIAAICSMETLSKSLGDGARAIEEAASAIKDLASGYQNSQPGSVKAEEQVPAAPSSRKAATLEEVRGFLAERAAAGFRDQVKQVVSRYASREGGKLSDVNPDNYAALLEEARFTCRELYTKDEVKARAAELIAEGHGKTLSELFEHHMCTSVDNLAPSSYAYFMRDAWGADHVE